MLILGKRRCSEEGSGASEAGVAAAELSASEQPADYHRPPGQAWLCLGLMALSTQIGCITPPLQASA